LNENPIFNPFRDFFFSSSATSREIRTRKTGPLAKQTNKPKKKQIQQTNKREYHPPQTRQLISRPALFVISPFSYFVDFPRIQPIAYCMAALSPGFSFFASK
jgi:hypothetical protein